MDENTYIQSLVAQYFKDNGLKTTLAAMEQELNKKFTNPVHDESLESIIRDRINFKDLPQFIQSQEENVNTLDTFNQSDIIKAKNIVLPNWSIKYPDSLEVLNLGALNSLIISSSFFHSVINGKVYNLGLFVTNTKYILAIDMSTNEILLTSFDTLHGQSIKIITGITHTDHIIICDMNGSITSMKFVIDTDGNWDLVDSIYSKECNLKLHRRLITDFKYLSVKKSITDSSPFLGYFASIGWDSRVNVGKIELVDNKIKFSTIDDYKLFTNPTSVIILEDKETKLPMILVGRLESSLLTIFTIFSDKLLGLAKLSLNDSEFSSHSFQPMAIAEIASANDDVIVTVATDHIPYMRLITVVVPSLTEILTCEIEKLDLKEDTNGVNSILSKFATEHTENIESFQSKTPILRSYIISNFNSLSPQDKYSNPIILCRPQCSGLWIPGDDGKLRGFDLRTGAVVETLDSNDGRAKSAFIGQCGDNSEVIVICGAVDKKISIWKCSS